MAAQKKPRAPAMPRYTAGPGAWVEWREKFERHVAEMREVWQNEHPSRLIDRPALLEERCRGLTRQNLPGRLIKPAGRAVIEFLTREVGRKPAYKSGAAYGMRLKFILADDDDVERLPIVGDMITDTFDVSCEVSFSEGSTIDQPDDVRRYVTFKVIG